MASDGWVPEIVVGIDFGMTCTGMLGFLLAAIISSSVSRSPKIFDTSRCRLLHGSRLGRAENSSALARQDD